MGLGLYLSRRAATSLVDFFVSGRSLPWWLAGTSMAATTFSIDTPLYICGVVASRGIAGNWEWWSFGIAHVVLIYVFARLWRRSEIVTDAELTEMRYGGDTAATLRGIKAFLFAVPINCIGIGTDFFQFFLGLTGAIAVAVVAVLNIGGIHELISQVQQTTDLEVLAFFPLTWGQGGINWNDAAGITATTFSAYIFLQWWSFRRSDGGGEFVQRIAAAKDEAEAEKASWFFNILHYIIRTWPWILVALAAMVIYPDLSDRELGYPKLMLDFLPPVLLGLVVASLIAAFMSTVSTSINWGASYLTNDLFLRFMKPDANQAELVMVGRIASVMVTILGAIAAFFAKDITTVFRLVIAIGTGPGLVLVLRWFWWRINAAAELAAMISGFVIGLSLSVIPGFSAIFPDFGYRLLFISTVTAIIWISVMYLTPPESDEVLDGFYLRVRPGGIGWLRQRERTGVLPMQDLKQDLLKVSAAILLLFGSMFAIGGFLLLQPVTGWISLIIAVVGGFWLRKFSKKSGFPKTQV